jgi:hypothetical protein
MVGNHVKAIVKHYNDAIKRSANRVGGEAVASIKEKMTRADVIKSGAARRSINWGVEEVNVSKKRMLEVTIGGHMNYLIFIEDDTVPHLITAKKAKALAFPARKAYNIATHKHIGSKIHKGGNKTAKWYEFYKSVWHPGTKGVHMFLRTMNELRNGGVMKIIMEELKNPPKIKRVWSQTS